MKSRGNRLNKQGAYFFWRGPINTLSGWDVAGVEQSAWGTANVKLPSVIYVDANNVTFANNIKLESLPKILPKIGCSLFASGCTSLKSYDFGSKTKSDQPFSLAFQSCTSLVSVTNIPFQKLMYSSGYYNIFSGCVALTTLTFQKGSQIGGEFDCGDCPLDDNSVLAIAFILSTEQYYQSTLKLKSSTATTQSTEHVRLKQSGDGLEFCNVGDSGDLGTLAEYITNKGWTLTLV
ncbi:MAG: hypothetical protein J6S67_26175 [Methanobrevibacter sp.]|nr:hypothetical protein [Methanobrevibacter sp.]